MGRFWRGLGKGLERHFGTSNFNSKMHGFLKTFGQVFRIETQSLSRAAHERPRSPLEHPKSSPRTPQERPRASQSYRNPRAASLRPAERHNFDRAAATPPAPPLANTRKKKRSGGQKLAMKTAILNVEKKYLSPSRCSTSRNFSK